MIPNEIENEEFLYRRILNIPNYWKPETNRHSSAAFKQSNGLSVDRSHTREDSDIIELLKNTNMKNIKAIAKIKCETCISILTFPIYKPEADNIYHSEIHNSNSIVLLTNKQSKNLSDLAIPIGINELL
jgi:hypothetical protein